MSEERKPMTKQRVEELSVLHKAFTPEDALYAIDDLIAEVCRLQADNETLRAALEWCRGSADFGEGGKAVAGWKKIVEPALASTVLSKEMR